MVKAEDLANVRLSHYATGALQRLQPAEARSVAQAIGRIKSGGGKTMKIQPSNVPGGTYKCVVPDDDIAPVVIYRALTSNEGGGYLVTALTDRGEFERYERAARDGFLDTDLGHLITGVATVAGTVTATSADSSSGVSASDINRSAFYEAQE
jgi:hypothetical protein